MNKYKKYVAHNSLLPFYFAHHMNHLEASYNLCFSYSLENEKQVTLLTDKLQELIRSQAYLRQTFALEDEKLMAYIHEELPAGVYYFNTVLEELEQLEKNLSKEQHDIQLCSSIKLNIIFIEDANRYVALFNIHHILMDGYSIEQFITDLNHLLSGNSIAHVKADEYILKLEHELPLKGIPNDDPEILEYIKKVNDIAKNLDLVDSNFKSDVLYYQEVLPDSLKKKLVGLSEKNQISKFNLLLLSWSLFIAKLNHQEEIIVTYPVNIRKQKTMSGCFVNTIVFPLTFSSESTYQNLIDALHNQLNFFKKISKYSLANQLDVGSISSFANSDFAQPQNLLIDGVSIAGKGYPQIANSSVSIKYKEVGDSLYFSCDIFSGIFPPFFAASLLPRYFNYLDKLLNDPTQLLSSINLTFVSEERQILYEFNQTFELYYQDQTLISLFEKQVESTPHHIALVSDGTQLTYWELNEKANQMARFLSEITLIKPDDLIALFLERNEYMVICMLAVLKTGAAYVPLDLSYPLERVDYILEDTQAKIILTNEKHQDKLKHILLKGISVISIENKIDQISTFDKTNIITANTSENLAYVIYTSGTTGRPKGVMIEHKSVLNTLYYLKNIYQRNNEEKSRPLKITAFTSAAFDVSVSEIFVPLLQGDELHLLNNTLKMDVILISQYLIENQINYMYIPPILLTSLPRIKYPALQGLIYAGEPCDEATARYWSQKLKLYNYYGPTETSIYATGLQIKNDEVHLIGKPISNTTAYILNSKMMLQPIGIVGELYIGGIGVARGYLNQQELTTDRFVSNPFQTADEKIKGINFRIYKTGDLVRWHPDGNIEYIGRNDFQVKLRGYRIELGEIENILSKYPGVKQVVVMVNHYLDQEDTHRNSQFLVAYYISEQKIDDLSIKEYLALHLPDYMQPNVFIHLNHFPLTPNGKLDRNALPKPEFTPNQNYIAPTNEKETFVCKAFEELLAITKVGIDDDFFSLGGNSILAISLVSKLQSSFNINVADVFNLKTPKKIARDISFVKDNLVKNLEKIKHTYQTKFPIDEVAAPFQSKLDSYFLNIHHLQISLDKSQISNVLLTGATGYLGCNLLNTLLKSTDYSVFLLIRASSDEEAFRRINDKFKFYFTQSLDSFRNTRLFVYAADIEKKDLGISKETYGVLVNQIDSIIHSAALTKHYGEYDTFYSANVQATKNLLDLSQLTKLKHFNYISTSSVLNIGHVPNCTYYLFTEDDDGNNLEGRSNIYVKTKYEGEKVVIAYRQHGINANIYRVGNLAFTLNNFRAQENVYDNAFFIRLSSLIEIGMIAPEISLEEISPVDLTADAIVKLFDKKCSNNHIFHVFNPYLCPVGEILTEDKTFDVKMVDIEKFINTIIKNLYHPHYKDPIQKFLLHRRWLNESYSDLTHIHILQDRTNYILKQLGFEWTKITSHVLLEYLKKEIKHA